MPLPAPRDNNQLRSGCLSIERGNKATPLTVNLLETNTSPLTYCTMRLSRVLPLMNKPLSIALTLILFQSLQAFEPTEDGIYAVFDTSLGEFTAKIAYDAVPLTAANFIGLAEGDIPRIDPATGEIVEQKPFYDGLIFHFVTQNSFIQSGDPDADDPNLEGPGYAIPEEIHPNLSHNPDYSLSMVNGSCTSCPAGTREIGDNSTGSQFFFTAAAVNGNPPAGFYFDGYFSVFGVAVDGTDVIDAIGNVPVDLSTGRPIDDVIINHVTILREGEDAEAFSVTDYDLPYRLPAPELEAELEGDNQVSINFEAKPGINYTVETSENLKNWSAADFLNDQNSTTTLEVQTPGTGNVFARAKRPSKDATNFDLPFTNLKLETILTGAAPGENWTFEFKEDGTGTVTIQRESTPVSAPIDFHAFHKIPGGMKIRMSMSQIGHEIVLHMKYSTENTGGIYAWLDDYISGTQNNPLRYPVVGSFQVAE